MCPEFNLVVLFCYFRVLLTQVVVLSVFGRAVQIYEYVAAHNCGLLECLNFKHSGHHKKGGILCTLPQFFIAAC